MFNCLGRNAAVILVVLSWAKIGHGQCALNTAAVNTQQGKATLNPVTTGDKFITGAVIFSAAPTPGTVCVSIGVNTADVPSPLMGPLTPAHLRH